MTSLDIDKEQLWKHLEAIADPEIPVVGIVEKHLSVI